LFQGDWKGRRRERTAARVQPLDLIVEKRLYKG